MENRFRGYYAKEDVGKVKLFLRSLAEVGSDAQSSPTMEQISELLRKSMLMLDDFPNFIIETMTKRFFAQNTQLYGQGLRVVRSMSAGLRTPRWIPGDAFSIPTLVLPLWEKPLKHTRQ